MREILFRGKRRDNGEWVEGWYIHTKRHHCIITSCIDDGYVVYGHYASDVAMYVVDPDTVGQFTGLTANGKRIFEGDIIKYHEPFVMKATGIVRFGENRWNANTNVGFYMEWVIAKLPDILRTDLGFWCNEREVEVIGNIHDNPKLLEGEG